MDSSGLKESMKQYEEQLQEVNSALQSSQDDGDKKALNDLKSDLQQLIQLTKENLEAVDKQNNLNTEENSRHNENAEIDDEYALFMAEMSGTGAFDKGESTAGPENSENCDIEDELASLLGLNCAVHYTNKWGSRSLCSAMICALESMDAETEFQELQVRILFTHPTHVSMLPCPYFLEDKCTFESRKCRFSHGERVSLSSLKDAIEPDLSGLKPGSRVLVKIPPPSNEDMTKIKKCNEKYYLWHPAVISEVSPERNLCSVRLTASVGDKRKHCKETMMVALEDIFPADDTASGNIDSDDSLSDTEYPDAKSSSTTHTTGLISERASMAHWEVHTRGIGSKIMLAMGYVAGQGLGKSSSGRVEPVQAAVLPRRVGLCSSLESGGSNAIKVEERLKRLQKKEMERCKKLEENAKERERRNVFNFLNNTLGDPTSKSDSVSKNGDCIQIAGTSDKTLNVEKFKLTEEVRRIERDIDKLTRSLARYSEGSVGYRNIASQLAGRKRDLVDCRTKETAISKEQKKRKDKEKLSVF